MARGGEQRLQQFLHDAVQGPPAGVRGDVDGRDDLAVGVADGGRDRPQPFLELLVDQGPALGDQELEEGLRSIAAPIRDADGQVIAAINVSTHAGRRTLNSIVEELLQPLLATARRIELDLARSRASVRARPDA